MENTLKASLRRYHNRLEKHAFTCSDIFYQAYHETLDAGQTVRQALARARVKHDEAVQYTLDTVGLD